VFTLQTLTAEPDAPGPERTLCAHKSAGLPICTAAGSREAVGHRDVPDETCQQCGGRLRVIASIEEPAIIERILDHLGHTAKPVDPAHPSRAPAEGDRLV
jgi:hypothetical protein